MSSAAGDKAIGFAQEIPGGAVFEIGNRWIHRRIHCISGRVGTTSLVNNTNGEEYLDQVNSEFEIELRGEGQKVVLEFSDFAFQGYETVNWDDTVRTLRLRLQASVNDVPLTASLYYEARAGESFIRKWVAIDPCHLEGWTIRRVVIENLKFKELVEGIAPRPRYPHTYDSHEDNVHEEPEKVDMSRPEARFEYGDLARAAVAYWGYGEGLYFFTHSLLGEETFYRPKGLAMAQRTCSALTDGLETGFAVIGAYAGPPEIGLKRYNEHLMNHWCAVKDKPLPVAWNTWLITLDGNAPVLNNYDRNLLLEYIELMRRAGFYDVLRLDLGWESGYPLQADPAKFPEGLSEIARRASEVAGVDMAYWVNPFSANYWRSRVEDQHPEYLVPGKVSSRSGANAVCAMSDHFHYIKKRFIELAEDFGARMIYWDGADWNIPACTARNHGHRDQDELEVKGRERLAELCAAAHQAREDLLVVAFSLPPDNHRLRAVDQEHVSDTYSFPTVKAELIQRQQLYQMTFEHPYKAIYGSWYGVNWQDAGNDNLSRPLRELMNAEMSMIGNGLAQAGASFDLKQAKPEFVAFMKKLLAFRKRFEGYFDVYQHVLGFPDGEHVDGSGHIVDGSGFIVLVNPTESDTSVRVPLDEPELELSRDKKSVLTDWTSLERGTPIGSFAANNPPEIDLLPLQVKYIGVNVA